MKIKVDIDDKNTPNTHHYTPARVVGQVVEALEEAIMKIYKEGATQATKVVVFDGVKIGKVQIKYK